MFLYFIFSKAISHTNSLPSVVKSADRAIYVQRAKMRQPEHYVYTDLHFFVPQKSLYTITHDKLGYFINLIEYFILQMNINFEGVKAISYDTLSARSGLLIFLYHHPVTNLIRFDLN